jgi:hypothetical protein
MVRETGKRKSHRERPQETIGGPAPWAAHEAYETTWGEALKLNNRRIQQQSPRDILPMRVAMTQKIPVETLD